MAAGDPGVLKRNFSAVAIETTLVNNLTSAATGDTTTSVAVVSVSGFPTAPFTLILGPDTSKEEVVTCVSVVGTTLQIVRGQDSTGAVAHTAGTAVRHGVSGRDFKEEQTHQAARGYDADTAILSSANVTHVHGLVSGDGSVVGSTQSVTLTRKTLTTPIVNGATISGAFTSTATITGGTVTSGTITSSTVTSSTITSGTLGSNLAAGGFKITGLGTPTTTGDATTYEYVNSILGSATAASTSATSAATSATSAAASATAAATSATSAAASATAAATSASSALTSQTAAATSATSAAASATAAATSATSSATSATASASSASAAATSASSAATSASSAATSATASASSASAAATSAASAATSATSSAASTSAAAASASAAATSATSASASATAAATSATSAATSASSALTSQTAAATSATSAATSASSALTSQTAAATSATSAATSASSAATTYTAYDVRYLGSKASAPTVNNQGGALITGATYWNSVANLMYAYDGATWNAISTTTSYSAPTLGSTTIVSGTTYANITGLTINSTTIPTSKTLVDINSAQTLTNKTLSGIVTDGDPTTALGVVTKQYVDSIAAGINTHDSAQCATDVAVTGTYTAGTTGADGGTGVGAYFTVTTTGVLTIDGYTTVLNDRILLKNQADAKQNGIYKVTTAGAVGVSAVLTRATDYDNSIAGEVFAGDMVFIQNGTANANYGWLMNTVGTSTTPTKGIKIGTDNLNWTQFSSPGPLVGTAPIAVSGATVSLNTSGVTAGTYALATITVNDKGLITAASASATPAAGADEQLVIMGAYL